MVGDCVVGPFQLIISFAIARTSSVHGCCLVAGVGVVDFCRLRSSYIGRIYVLLPKYLVSYLSMTTLHKSDFNDSKSKIDLNRVLSRE